MIDNSQHRVACACPLCEAGVPSGRIVSAKLDGRPVLLRLSEKTYQKLEELCGPSASVTTITREDRS